MSENKQECDCIKWACNSAEELSFVRENGHHPHCYYPKGAPKKNLSDEAKTLFYNRLLSSYLELSMIAGYHKPEFPIFVSMTFELARLRSELGIK